MAFKGYEKKRKALKYLCPAKVYRIKCEGIKNCLHSSGIRIPLSLDRRIFTPVARSSYKWKTLYNGRSSVERVNSRVDGAFSFDKHFIRGLKKMKMRCSLSLCVMLTVALIRARQGRYDLMRSLLKTG